MERFMMVATGVWKKEEWNISWQHQQESEECSATMTFER